MKIIFHGFYLILILFLLFFSLCSSDSPYDVINLNDQNWDQIQRGKWLIGFFDNDVKESASLAEDWKVFAFKCKEQDINVGYIQARDNPGLSVRFIMTTPPRAFYIQNGVAHPIPDVDRHVLTKLLLEKTWGNLKPVSFLKNPFSFQMSLVSYLFIRALAIYNYENEIVQSFVPYPPLTDVFVGLTFIFVGTAIGLFVTVIVSIFQVLLRSRSRGDASEIDEKAIEEDDADENDIDEESDSTSEIGDSPSTVRRRK